MPGQELTEALATWLGDGSLTPLVAEVLDAALKEHPDDEEMTFMVRRLRGLLSLARIGYQLVESFAEVGLFSLDPIRGALSPQAKDAR